MSGAHALKRPWRKWVIGLLAIALITTASFLGDPGSRAGAATGDRAAAANGAQLAARVPDQDACKRTDNYTPRGDCGPFRQLYRDDFGTYGTVPVGAFSQCAGEGGAISSHYVCAGLKDRYPHYHSTLGAYPSGWPDTAGNGADGNSGPVPGVYRPDRTVSVIRQPNNDGQLRVRMFRPSTGGFNQVAALVPLACKNLRYGKFTERFVVRQLTKGFKMAHLHYSPDEIDYPEAGLNFPQDPIGFFTHGFDNYGKSVAPNSAWLGWHTYSTEITPGRVKIFFDGKLVADRRADYPRATPWILQNESALNVPASQGAAPGSSVTIDTTWITCYSYRP